MVPGMCPERPGPSGRTKSKRPTGRGKQGEGAELFRLGAQLRSRRETAIGAEGQPSV